MIRFKRGDTRYALKATLKRNGTPADLTGCTVRFFMSNGCITINRPVDILDPVNGLVWVIFDQGDTDAVGTYRAEFEVTHADGRKETFPSSGYLSLQIVPDLG